MYKITPIQIPNEFGILLKSKLNNNWHHYGPLSSSKHPFYVFVRYALGNLDPKSNINDILRTLGWVNFRNRIANCYLQKIKINSYTQTDGFEHITSVMALEEKYQRILDPKSTRCFLFFFLRQLSMYSDIKSVQKFDIDLPAPVSSFLINNIHHKIEYFDWFCIMLWKVMDYYDSDDILRFIHDYPDNFYKQLIYHLGPEQKFEFYSEILNYSYCINETDLFFKFFTI